MKHKVKRFEGLGRWSAPFSWVYGLGLYLHRMLYQVGIVRPFQAPKPVVSIGNVVVGGVGKTPMTVWVVKEMLACGIKPAVVLRGYKSYQGVSDEAAMLTALLPSVPVVSNPSRRQAIEQVVRSHNVDLVVCDDAFQHWALRRDLDIVLIDTTNPFGNGWLLPVGILREPLSAIRRAGVVVMTKSDDDKPARDLAQRILEIHPQVCLARARHQFRSIHNLITCQNEEIAAQENVLAVSAIADPVSFERTLVVNGFKVMGHLSWPDHQPFTPAMQAQIEMEARLLNVSVVVTTHKDAVKLLPLIPKESTLRWMRMDIQVDMIEGKDDVVRRLLAVCRR